MCQPGRPGADHCLPRSLARFRGLPQGKITGAVFFVFIHIDAGAVFHSGKIFLGKFSVGGKFGNAEIVGSVVGAVGESFFLQFGDKLCHLRDVIGGPHQSGLFDVQGGDIFEKSLLIFRGVLLDAHTSFR